MNTKTLITTGVLTATVVTGGWIFYESMKSNQSGDNPQNINASFKPVTEESEAGEAVSSTEPVEGESVFLKRPVLDMSKAVSKGTLTSGMKLKRERERAKRSRRYLKIGFTGHWKGLSPFAVNESIIAKAQISVSGNSASGWLWIVTEFKQDGVQCSIVKLDEARVVGNLLTFRAANQAGSLEMGKKGETVSGTWSGRTARLVRIPPTT